MGFGTVSVTSLATLDAVAPGAPTFVSLVQSSNSTIDVTLSMPTADADGTPLTGLAKLTVATLAGDPSGFNPFEGLSMDQILTITGIQAVNVVLTPADAGTQKGVQMSVTNLGGTQWFAAACAD